MGEDTWYPSLVSVHAYTTCIYTQVHGHWSMRTRTHNKIEKKRIKVGEQSQETGSAQVRRVPAEGHWEKCSESPWTHDGRGVLFSSTHGTQIPAELCGL